MAENFEVDGGEMTAIAVADDVDEGLTELESDSSATLQGSESSSQYILEEVHKARKLAYINFFRKCERSWELRVSLGGYYKART